ncbi:MAG: PGPGW domain-containing protein [Candidatus Tectomicrobia bacterium]|nr:PGPGW domain-containing protein [Candidatus Tectomicrobia bacterium]
MLPEWLRMHETTLWWMGSVSMLTFIGTLIVIPLLAVRIPTDYFIRDRQHRLSMRDQLSVPRLIGLVLKNVIGLIFILAGIAMLVLPGQGVLTILLGIMLMNFPGKATLELHIVQQPTVLRAINWMRNRANHPPLLVTPKATCNPSPSSDV